MLNERWETGGCTGRTMEVVLVSEDVRAMEEREDLLKFQWCRGGSGGLVNGCSRVAVVTSSIVATRANDGVAGTNPWLYCRTVLASRLLMKVSEVK